MENSSHKSLKHMSGKTKISQLPRVNCNSSKTMKMGGPGKGVFRSYDHQNKLNNSKPSSSKPSNGKPSSTRCDVYKGQGYLRLQDEELHVEETRHSFSPPLSRGRRVRTRNQYEEYQQEHDHEGETRNSFSPPQSHGRRVRIRNEYNEYQQEPDHEGDSIQTDIHE